MKRVDINILVKAIELIDAEFDNEQVYDDAIDAGVKPDNTKTLLMEITAYLMNKENKRKAI